LLGCERVKCSLEAEKGCKGNVHHYCRGKSGRCQRRGVIKSGRIVAVGDAFILLVANADTNRAMRDVGRMKPKKVPHIVRTPQKAVIDDRSAQRLPYRSLSGTLPGCPSNP
jgi:hypothetical protein